MHFLDPEEIPQHGPNDPHAYSMRAKKYHAIALTKSCPVEAPQCDEKTFQIERQIFANIFCKKKMVFAAMLLKKINLFKEQVFRNNAVGV